jgi:hypothetical protein
MNGYLTLLRLSSSPIYHHLCLPNLPATPTSAPPRHGPLHPFPLESGAAPNDSPSSPAEPAVAVVVAQDPEP